MQGKRLFEYAVIRVVPRVEREEFLNAGVILYCAAQRFLAAEYHLDSSRLMALHPGLDLPVLESRLQAFACVCAGGADSGPIGLLPAASRFRWLTAARSTIVQTSPVHPGFCTDAPEMLTRLFTSLVS